MNTGQIMRALPETCEKCGQAPIDVEHDTQGSTFKMLRTGHLVCGPCFDAYRAAELAPQGETVKLFEPARTQLAGQLAF